MKIYKDIKIPDEDRLVGVCAYTLMPNHFHFILQQKKENGITRFLQKVGTAYSMYFNKKYEHSGTLFQGPFKSKHVDTGDYLRWLFAYVYCNPQEIGAEDISKYAYSSFSDVCAKDRRPEANIIAWNVLRELEDDHPREVASVKQIIKARPLY